jgi:hypothetical protein
MSPALPRYQHTTQPRDDDAKLAAITDQAAWERKLAEILIDVGEAAPTASSFGTTIADTQLLRGIPVVGAVCGTSPGTDPLAELLRNDRLAR